MIHYKTTPHPHQKSLVEFAIDLPFVGIFDKPGSGKTKMALDLAANRDLDRIFIALPVGLIPNWREEIAIHYSGSAPIEFISYGKLSVQKGLDFKMGSRDLLIFDESHQLKSTTAKRCKYLKKYLQKNCPQIITMTGTPMPNDRRDLYMQAFLCNIPAGNVGYHSFKQRYCEIVKDFWGAEIYKGDLNTEELMEQFAKCAVFRVKSDFLNLPDKQYSPQYYEYPPKLMKAFKSLARDAALLLEDGEDMEIVRSSMSNMMRLSSGYVLSENAEGVKEFCNIIPFKDSPKFKMLQDLLETFETGEPVIIYSCFVKDVIMIHELLNGLGYKTAIKHGQLSPSDAQQAIEDFKSGKFQILVATVQSTHVGFTLTTCAKIVYYNNSFKSVEREQSEDRIHRISQERNCVYYDIIAKGMLDEQVMLKVQNKIEGQMNWIAMFKDFVKQQVTKGK